MISGTISWATGHILICYLTGQNGIWIDFFTIMFHLYGLVKVIKFQIEILVSQKSDAKISLISAPASKKIKNQKNKGTLLS